MKRSLVWFSDSDCLTLVLSNYQIQEKYKSVTILCPEFEAQHHKQDTKGGYVNYVNDKIVWKSCEML